MRYVINGMLCLWLLTFGCYLCTAQGSTQHAKKAPLTCEQQCTHCTTDNCTPKDIRKCRCRCQKEEKLEQCEQTKEECSGQCTTSCTPVSIYNMGCCFNCSMNHNRCTAEANSCTLDNE